MEWGQLAAIAVGTLIAGIALNLWDKRSSKFDELTNAIRSLSSNFNSFVGDYMSESLKGASDYIIHHSPVELTEQAEQLAKDSGLTAHIEANLPDYSKQIRASKTVDILSACRTIASQRMYEQKGVVDVIKYFIEGGISRLILQEIFAIKLRNLYQNKENPKK